MKSAIAGALMLTLTAGCMDSLSSGKTESASYKGLWAHDAINDAEVARRFRLAADQGDAKAQWNFAYMYKMGWGVPQDYIEAARWFRMAAEQGFAGGQGNLGGMYRDGLGVPQDYVEAHKWFNLAASKGDETAAGNRDFLAKQMTAEQIAEAQKRAREWSLKKG